MKKNISLTFVLLVLVFWGCSNDNFFSSYNNSCITPDGKKIGIITEDTERIFLDAETGKILSRANSKSEKEGRIGNPGNLLCSEDNQVFAVYPEKIINLANGSDRLRSGGKPMGLIGKEELVSYGGGKMSPNSTGNREADAPLRETEYYKGEPLAVYLEKIGKRPEKNKPLSLPLSQFEGVRKDAYYYWIIPFRLSEDKKLLVMAGGLPEEYDKKGKYQVQPEPWGFFKVNPEDGEIEPFGKIKTGDTEINLLVPPRHSATFNGNVIAIATNVYNSYSFAVFDSEKDEEVLRKTLPEGESIEGILLDRPGKRVAAVVKYLLEREKDRIQYSVRVYDIQTQKKVSEFAAGEETPNLVDFRDNEIIFNKYPATILKADIKTGEPVWETNYLKE
jgi:hypothetical protein